MARDVKRQISIAAFAGAVLVGFLTTKFIHENKDVAPTVKHDTVVIVSDDVALHAMNTDMIASFESCDTNMYWPGGKSGPTIGIGVDLGHIAPSHIDTLFQGLVTEETLRRMHKAHGLSGAKAKAWVKKNPIVVTRAVAEAAWHRTCRLFWRKTKARFPGVEKLPYPAQGVMLSLSINYGPEAKALRALRDPVRLNDKRAILEHMRKLEAGVTMRGLVRRRQTERRILEATLI
jgi:GH24 family phage-related lysozyme (muramidase)